MNKSKILIPAFVILLLSLMAISTMVYAKSGGISGRSISGCTCHGSTPSSGVGVLVSGPTSVMPGVTSTYTVTVTGGRLTVAGLDVSVTDGTLVVTDSTNTQLMGGEITHTSAGISQTSWSFDWTSPSTPGTVTMYIAGLSGDGNGGTKNDEWNLASMSIDVQGPVPEFPLGLATIIVLGLGAAIVQTWLRGRKPKDSFQ